MKIIITESQHNSVQTKLKDMVKKLGWVNTSKVVGGSENLAKVGFNNDPIEFLNVFNDLDVVQSKEERNWTLFRYKKGDNLMVYDRKTKYVYINYDEIWSVLSDEFNLDYSEIQQLTQEWLDEVYNLKGIPMARHYGHFELNAW